MTRLFSKDLVKWGREECGLASLVTSMNEVLWNQGSQNSWNWKYLENKVMKQEQ